MRPAFLPAHAMNNCQTRRLVAPTLALGMVLASAAATAATEIALGSGLTFRQVEEFSPDGNRLLRETGLAPNVGIELTTDLGPGRVFAGIGVERHRLDYDGQTQRGRPLSTDSDYRAGQWWLGYRVLLTPRWSLGLRWEQGYTQRDIRATPGVAGLDERYRSQWGAIGLRHTLASGPVEWIEAEWRHSLGGEQRISSTGLIDPVWLPLGQGNAIHLSARIPLGAAGWFQRIDLVPGVSRFHYSASPSRVWLNDGVVQGRINQPERTEWQLGAGLRLSW